MNENEKVIAALGDGVKKETPNAADVNTDIEKMRQAKELWAKRAQDNAKRISELEAENQRLRSGSTVKAVTDKLTEEELGDTPKEFVEKSGMVAATLVEQAEGRQAEELKKLREEIAERDRNAFLNAIGGANQKFFADVGPGGDKTAMWEQFKANNRETFAAIMQTHDAKRFNQMVGSFYREIGVPNPSGVQGGSAAPDPRSTVGGQTGALVGGVAEGQTFTQEEYLAALDKAETDFRANGDVKAYRAATEALNKAINEGRVR